ncbi:type II toxin-antitoxin system RelE/ParE family toxin [Enterobacter sp. 170198]|uniref:Type II toxin-antitoxin system RelE/ParE family toxin n=1 Tax=Enterobacter chinensis TaxID=3030997 RepID=A0ABU5D714_9ENTR|nr:MULTISPECIES: type II toxin-antitoxin system RelE/ParE family toxin [Enterobacteriaceae]MDY0419233.1 type II toxin-antitoxin system RelE/ParE family toxin [Enterobacter sp. 170198]TFB22508.1 type II toxin-antitoxin system RelE/ParE family toxin [Lelliottia nimipressuralis]
MKKVKHYLTADGHDPFDDYLRSVKDPIAKAMIATRIARMATGNYGDCKPCRESVSELKIDQGPGYRVYFSEVTDPCDGAISLLLLGGTKKKQDADIDKAVEYLNDFKNRNER